MLIKNVDIGEEIRRRINRSGITKKEFCERIGISPTNLRRITESDKIASDLLVKVSEALEFNFFTLWCDEPVVPSINSTRSAVSLGGGAAVYGDGNNTGDVAACDVGTLEGLRRENEVLRQALKDKQMIIDLLTNRGQ